MQFATILNRVDKHELKWTPKDYVPLKADGIKQAVSWKSGTDLSQLAGKTVRLRIELKDADLYSFQFQAAKSNP